MTITIKSNSTAVVNTYKRSFVSITHNIYSIQTGALNTAKSFRNTGQAVWEYDFLGHESCKRRNGVPKDFEATRQ